MSGHVMNWWPLVLLRYKYPLHHSRRRIGCRVCYRCVLNEPAFQSTHNLLMQFWLMSLLKVENVIHLMYLLTIYFELRSFRIKVRSECSRLLDNQSWDVNGDILVSFSPRYLQKALLPTCPVIHAQHKAVVLKNNNN